MISADAIVVLGCRILPSGRPSAALCRRVAAGARAYHAGVAPTVIASGGRRWGAHAEARVMAEELARAGVPPRDVVLELCSLSTRENAICAAAALAAMGARRAAVVTCPWHMPRALANFRAAGVDAVALPTEHGVAGRLTRLYLAAHERVCTWNDARGAGRSSVLAERAREYEIARAAEGRA